MLSRQDSRYTPERRAAIRCAIPFLLIAILSGGGCGRTGPAAAPLQAARIALAEHEFSRAERLAVQVAEGQSASADAWKLAARAAVQSGALDRAAGYLAKIPDRDDPSVPSACRSSTCDCSNCTSLPPPSRCSTGCDSDSRTRSNCRNASAIYTA